MALTKKNSRSLRSSTTAEEGDNNVLSEQYHHQPPKPVNLKPVIIWATLILLAYLPLMEIINRALLGQDLDIAYVQPQSEPTASSRAQVESQLSEEDMEFVRQEEQPNNIRKSRHAEEEEEEENDEKEPEEDGADLEDHDAGLDEDGFPYGVLSRQSKSFFKEIQDEIDQDSLEARCHRYGFAMTPPANKTVPKLPRRIFFGGLIAEEPWELLEIVAAETHGVYDAMVFVEGNRTQMFYPREFKRANDKHTQKMKDLFGVSTLQIRRYVNENKDQQGLWREHLQRHDILLGWKELGMTKDDVGLISDADETFSRDFLRAIQYCPYIKALDYEAHKCLNTEVKIVGSTQVFETSPVCVTDQRAWFHPDMLIGACIEEIGDSSVNPIAQRESRYIRAPGWGKDCNTTDWEKSYGKLPNKDLHPLFSAGDFRMQCGGRMYEAKRGLNRTKYSAFHFHNFFANFESTRRKVSVLP